jgi:hypothetical protein
VVSKVQAQGTAESAAAIESAGFCAHPTLLDAAMWQPQIMLGGFC